jgi:hypothetical protein
MRASSKTSILFSLASIGLVSISACSADGGAAIGDDSDAAGPASQTFPVDAAAAERTDATVPTPPPPPPGEPDAAVPVSDAAVPETGAVDARVVEAGQDAGGPMGSPCAPLNDIEQQTCGTCGFQTRTCLPADGGATGKWGAWGFCQGQVPGGCTPGQATTEACGNCGTRQKVCQNDCSYAVGSCQGEPSNACAPGSTDFEVGLSCDVGGRERVCGAACTWGNFGGCFVPEGGTASASIKIPTTVGSKASAKFSLPAAQTIGLLADTCPSATIGSSTTSYQYVEVYNPTAKTAKVSVWTAKATGGADIDTVMAAYNGVNVPLTASARMACAAGVNDGCSDTDPTACQSSWAGLVGTDAVAIGGYGSVLIYNAAFNDSSSSSPHSGPYQLVVRTDSLQ